MARLNNRCSVEGCDKPARGGRGWCYTHYARWYRHGTIDARLPVRRSPKANPWVGRVDCPVCDSDRWTMPYGHIAPGVWLCIACHSHTFTPTMSHPTTKDRRS